MMASALKHWFTALTRDAMAWFKLLYFGCMLSLRSVDRSLGSGSRYLVTEQNRTTSRGYTSVHNLLSSRSLLEVKRCSAQYSIGRASA